MTFEIHGLGTAAPECGISQDGAARAAEQLCCESEPHRRLLRALYRRAGVEYRRSVVLQPRRAVASCQAHGVMASMGGELASPLPDHAPAAVQSFFEPAVDADDCGPTTAQRMQMYEHHAPLLAQKAASAALKQSGFSPDEITHLVTVSCTGQAAPGVDLALIKRCGLRPSVARTHIGFMGCHGAINGLRVASAFAESDPHARILLCAVELCTLHQQYGWRPDRIVSNALFADGAASVVGAGAGGRRPTGHWRVAGTASTVITDTEDLMGWHVRDHGFEMSLSAEVPQILRCRLRPWLVDWLLQHDLALDEVGCWAVHPGGPRILRACEEALEFDGVDLQASHDVLAEYGNMSSPTVLFILERLMRHGSALPCVVLGFGPGLSMEAALLA